MSSSRILFTSKCVKRYIDASRGYRWVPLHPCILMFNSCIVRFLSHTVSPSGFYKQSFASRTSKEPAKKEVVTVEEDPFDSPTYHIPEKPVTFTKGASYSFVILAGLAVAGASGYAVFKELMFQPKEYKVFDKAFKRIQDDGQVRVRIGSPITGYGQETRNRAARQRIPNRVFTDEEGVEHVEVNFFIRGPQGAGKFYTCAFNTMDSEWKLGIKIVDEPSRESLRQIIVETSKGGISK
ncbi:hypothetical protein YC2023_110599 [Brassica napus]